MAIENNPEVSPPPSEPEDTSKESLSLPSGNHPSQKKGHFRRIVLADMKLKDWITLLIIPLILSTTGFLLNNVSKTNSQLDSQQQALVQQQSSLKQQQASLQIVIDQQRETTLQTYINTIQDLLLNHQLGAPLKPNDSLDNITIQEVRELARARTLVALRGLDPERKGLLVQFIYGAGLIIGSHLIIDLIGANLSEADLGDANLSDANLTGANLSSADLGDANLTGANLTQQQLDQAFSCRDTILPQGLTCNKTS